MRLTSLPASSPTTHVVDESLVRQHRKKRDRVWRFPMMLEGISEIEVLLLLLHTLHNQHSHHGRERKKEEEGE